MMAAVLSTDLIPKAAIITNRIQESPSIFTLHMKLENEADQSAFDFSPGQFNMIYLPGVGEVPISIMSDPEDLHFIGHTIRAVGRVSNGLSRLRVNDRVGLRGPYGNGWPLRQMEDRDVIVITGGLGCAPVVAVIHYILRRRKNYGKLTIIQGVKKAEELIWREQYAKWSRMPDTQVVVAADQGAPLWPWHVGRVTEFFDQISIWPERTMVVMCGPEGMMHVSADLLVKRGLPEDSIYLSMERNMQCAVGHCGHCQFGGAFVCKDGPVFSWPQVKHLLQHRGF
jgi:sulfhydrogenase subunit gamma (sulfur reductase)